MGKFLTSRAAADLHSNNLSRHVLQQHDDSQLLGEIKLNGFAGEAMQTIEHANPYGFSTYPKGPSMIGGVMRYAVVFLSFLTGNRSHGVGMHVADRRFRLYKKKEGEVAVHDDQGQWIYLQRNGTLIKVPNGNSVTIQVDQQQQQQSSGMGQDATQIPQPVTTIKADKNGVLINIGDATAFVAPDFVVGHVGSDSRMVVNTAGAKIKKGANVIFVDALGCWSTTAMGVKGDSIPDGTDPS